MPNITLVGDDELRKRIDRLGGLGVLTPFIQRQIFAIQADIATYPPRPPNSRYRRTMNLGRSWSTRVKTGGGDVIGEVGNSMKYAPYVMGHEKQARVHQGRWRTDEAVLRAREPKIRRALGEYLNQLLGE